MNILRYVCGCCTGCHPPTSDESSQQNPQPPKDGHENDNAEGNGNPSDSSSSAQQAESENQAAPASKSVLNCKRYYMHVYTLLYD